MSRDETRRQSSCDGKERFATASLAQRVAARRRGRGRTNRKRVAYHCSFCGGWHVGSPIQVERRMP